MLDKSNIKKILIIKLRGIGDVVLSTIVLGNLKTEFPTAQIDYLTDSPSKPILDAIEQVNQVYIFPKKLLKRIMLLLTLRKRNYDMVFDFFSNPSTAQISFLSGARYRVGFPYKGRKYAYNLFGPSERNKFHNAQLHLEVLKSIGITSSQSNLFFQISDLDKSFVENYLVEYTLQNNLLIGISPSGGWDSKKCDSDKFAEIGKAVAKKYNATIIILWGPGDHIQANEIFKLIGDSAFLAPSTTIMQMAAFIKRCDFLIANDSGPMHISTAVGTPVLSLHGPTNPLHQGPFGDKHEWINLVSLDCIMCNLLVCPRNHECFRDLSLDSVLEKIDKLFIKNKIDVKK